MEKKLLLLLLTCTMFACNRTNQQTAFVKDAYKITIEIELPEGFEKDRIRVLSIPFDYTVRPTWEPGKPIIKGHLMKCTLYSDHPLVVDLRWVLGSNGMKYLFEPGDSIHIDFKKGKRPVYTGNNASKFVMQQQMHIQEAQLQPPKNPLYETTESLQDYLEWSNFLNAQLTIMDAVLALQKDHVTPLAYGYLKADKIADIEYMRLMKFGNLLTLKLDSPVSGKSLGEIFDTTACSKSAQWLHAYDGKVGKPHYFYDFIRRSVQRKYDFDLEHDSLKSTERKIAYAALAKETYKNLVLQDCMVFILTEEGLKEHTLKGAAPEIEKLLADYYAQPGYPEYKEYVREYEKKIKKWALEKNKQ